MAPNRQYIGYPGAREAIPPAGPKTRKEENNPSLRGLPLVVGATLFTKFSFLPKHIWANGGYASVRNLTVLRDYNWRFHPDVIPQRDEADSASILDFGPELSTPKPMDQPARYNSVADFHELYKSGVLTPLQVVEAMLPLTKRGQQPPGKYENAWVDNHDRDDIALAAARASTERWAAGKPLGLLDGVPISVKDDLDVSGYVSHHGMKYNPAEPFFKPAEKTIWPVQKLEEAGAIVVGKNNMHELGGDTSGCNPTWGTPTNWHNTSYYPGGSSSGAGSSLSAGLIPIAIGTDSGGSVRMPPNFNGVYGLKTSHHRTGFNNVSVNVIAPMAANVADLTIAYRVMSQRNPDDSIQSKFALSVPPPPTAKKVIGICESWWARADPRVAETCRAAVDHYKSLGYEVIDIEIPYLHEAQVVHGIICVTEMADGARGRTANPADWLTIINSPSKILLTVGAQTPSLDYLKYNQLRDMMMQHLAFLFEKHPGLLIVTPTSPLTGWKRLPGDDAYGFSDANVTLAAMSYCFLANLTGCPALTSPVGYLDPEQGEGKTPVGLMATAEWGCEEQLLQWAGDAEKYLYGTLPGGRIRPAGWLDVVALANGEINGVGDKLEVKNSVSSVA